MKLIFKFFLLLIIVFLFKACANIQSPTGGPKDVAPPKLTKSFPLNGSSNYRGKMVELIFNENISLKDINDQLIINPIPKVTYDAFVKKNKLIISFTGPLDINTTYTLSFRDAVRDVTENNISKNLFLAFSTGEEIDTLKINGTVSDARTNQFVTNVIVSLYKEGDTNNITNSKPLYFTRTESGGIFSFSNIKKGRYKIYALVDKGNDLIYNQRSEQTGFDSIDLEKNINAMKIKISRMDSKAPTMLNSKSDEQETSISFNEGLSTFFLKEEKNKNTDTLIYQLSADRKSAIIYNTKNIYDSIPVSFTAIDSSGNVLHKKLNIIFIKKDKTEKKEKKKTESVISKIEPADKGLIPGKMNVKLTFNKPIVKEDISQMNLKADSGKAEDLKIEDLNWQNNKTVLTINKKIIFKDSLVFNIPKGSFFNVFGDTSSNQKIVFLPKKEENFAIIKGQVKTSENNYFVELVDKDYKVIESVKNITAFDFEYILPGAYYLRAFADKNNNNKWDSGNLEENLQAEPMYYSKEKLDLRANWEITDLLFEF